MVVVVVVVAVAFGISGSTCAYVLYNRVGCEQNVFWWQKKRIFFFNPPGTNNTGEYDRNFVVFVPNKL